MAAYFGDGIGVPRSGPVIAGATLVLDNIVWQSVVGEVVETITMGVSDTATFTIAPARGGNAIVSLSIGDGIEVLDYDPATMRVTVGASDWPPGAGGEYIAQLTLTLASGVVYRVQDRLVVKSAI